MANPTPQDVKFEFLKTFRNTARHKHRYDVFRDFVTLAACSLHNALHKEEGREAEYMRIIQSYEEADQKAFPKLMGLLIQMLETEPRDILGPLYMELEISSKDQGQFFTPPDLSELMARMNMGSVIETLKTQPFITVSEPACGAGGMILALVKVITEQKLDPADKLWVQCIDVDRMAALMCYIQLTLWNVPAEIIVGDTLRWELREVWYTPAHHMGFWESRLKRREDTPEISAPDVSLEVLEEESKEAESDFDPYETTTFEWKGQALTIRWHPDYSPGVMAHLEILTEDRKPHPISETGYKSHFIQKQEVEDMGGPVAYVTAWLEELDDGKPVQLSLF